MPSLCIRLLLVGVVVALGASCPQTIATIGCESPRDCELGQLCGTAIAGRYESFKRAFGPRRVPIAIHRPV